jgi:hypothetical protein
MGLTQPVTRMNIPLNQAPSPLSSPPAAGSTPPPPPPPPPPALPVVWIAGEINTFTINPRDSYGNRAVDFYTENVTLRYQLLNRTRQCCSDSSYHCEWEDRFVEPLNSDSNSTDDLVVSFQAYLTPEHPLDSAIPNNQTLEQGPFVMSLSSDGRIEVQANITQACVFYLHISIGDAPLMRRYGELSSLSRSLARSLDLSLAHSLHHFVHISLWSALVSSPFLIHVVPAATSAAHSVAFGVALSRAYANVLSAPIWLYSRDSFNNSIAALSRFWQSEYFTSKRPYKWQIPRSPQLVKLHPFAYDVVRVYCWKEGAVPVTRQSHSALIDNLSRNPVVTVFSSDGVGRNGSSNGGCTTGSVVAHANGTFTMQYKAAASATTLIMLITLNGELLATSPYKIIVQQGVYDTSSTCTDCRPVPTLINRCHRHCSVCAGSTTAMAHSLCLGKYRTREANPIAVAFIVVCAIQACSNGSYDTDRYRTR